MSDSINEQRCEQHGQPKAHWYQRVSEYGVPIGKLWCSGPSVVTPPAQDEQRQTGWDYDEHPGDCHARKVDGCWVTCCRECAGTGVFPVPWIRSPEEGRARVPDDSSCVSCKGSGVSVVVPAAPSVSTDHTDEPRCSKDDSTFDEHYEAGLRDGRAELAELREAISDTSQYGRFDGADWLRGYDYRRRELDRD